MVDPKHEPGFEPEHNHPEHREKDKAENTKLRSIWRERMHSGLRRMSRGAQNIFNSFRHKDTWRSKNKKK